MQQSDLTNSAREHLIRELTKEIPLIGKILEAMTFGVSDDIKKKEDKAKIYGILNAASTDLGDILKQLQAQQSISAQMNEAITTLVRYVQGPADARAVIRVEEAVLHNTQLIPASMDSVASYLSKTPIDRYTLNDMLKGMIDIQIDEVIGDVPEAKDYVRTEAAKARKIQDLLDWAEGDDGPTLNGLYAYVQRRKAALHRHP